MQTENVTCIDTPSTSLSLHARSMRFTFALASMTDCCAFALSVTPLRGSENARMSRHSIVRFVDYLQVPSARDFLLRMAL